MPKNAANLGGEGGSDCGEKCEECGGGGAHGESFNESFNESGGESRGESKNAQKQQKIIAMFEDIAPSYDLANRVLSLGVDVRWRNAACAAAFGLLGESGNESSKKSSAESRGESRTLRIIDVACGSGDMIKAWLNVAQNAQITGLDPAENMLEVARNKFETKGKNHAAVALKNAEATRLGLENESADIVSIAYGLRNVVELDAAIAEFARVLRRGGLCVILEFTRKDKPNLLDKTALFYTQKILPLIGGAISRNYAAYRYLPSSIEGFLSLESLCEKLEKSGFAVRLKKRHFANLCSVVIAQKG